MARINTASIVGYEEMSAEEKLKALEEYEFEIPKDNSEVVEKLQAALNNASADASRWKKELRERQTEALRQLRRDKTVSGYIAQCLALGYTQDLAVRAAEAMADGNNADIFACQQEFLEAKQKEIEANALNKQPTLTVGSPPTAKEAEKESQNKLRGYFGLPPLK